MTKFDRLALLPIVAVLIGWQSLDPVNPAEPYASAQAEAESELGVRTVRVQPGETIEGLAANAYGHAKFAGFLLLVNGIDGPNTLPASSEIQVPSLPIAFRDRGIDPLYRSAVTDLAIAADDYFDLLPTYLEARKDSGVTGRGSFDLSVELKQRLLRNADRIDASNSTLQSAQSPHRPATKAAGQFRQASSLMRVLASGAVDGYGYDYDLVGQRLGLGFEYSMLWVQSGHR